MAITNDPRFFTDNLLNKRLAAFGALAVVSGLLAQNCMDQMFEMDKNMQVFTKQNRLYHPNGVMLLISFAIMCVILSLNLLAMYVGVAQPYHALRLMTSGPTGFEAAKSYYLNPNITQHRHFCIKGMLVSLILYLLVFGLRLIVKFDRSTVDQPSLPRGIPMQSRIQGVVFCLFMTFLSLVMWKVHILHFQVFRDRHAKISEDVSGSALRYVQESMHRTAGAHLDV